MDIQVESFPNSLLGGSERQSAVTGKIIAGAARTMTSYIATSSSNFKHIIQKCFLFISKIQDLLAKFRSNEKEKERARRYWSLDQYLQCLNKSKDK